MHPVLLVRALPALLPQEITLEEFQANSGIVSWTTAKDVLEYIINDGIGFLPLDTTIIYKSRSNETIYTCFAKRMRPLKGFKTLN